MLLAKLMLGLNWKYKPWKFKLPDSSIAIQSLIREIRNRECTKINPCLNLNILSNF